MSSGVVSQRQIRVLRFSLPVSWLAGASLALTIETFLLISLGGMVRNAGAGLSCPDWPLCFGKVVPPMDYLVFLEWFHRLMAGGISVFLLVLSLGVFLNTELRRSLGSLCALALVLLAGQIVLGGLTVLGLLDPKWVSSHLAIALAFFAVSVVLTLKLADWSKNKTKGKSYGALKGFALMAGLVLYGQILLGGLVSSNYAALACLDFPTCNGQWLPPLEGLVGFQVIHRIGALVATVVLTAFTISALRGPKLSARGRVAVLAIPALLTLQIFFGIAAVLMKLPLPVSVAHLATATALLAMLVVSNYEIRRGY